MKWTKEDVNVAISLNKSGKRIEEIANVLNRDFRSVQIKLQKLGLKQHKRQVTENVKCLCCGNMFVALIKNKRKFCSQSCSAEFNNRKFPKRKSGDKLKNCLDCGKPLNSHQHKFCSIECNKKYKINITFNKIEKGDTSFSSDTYKKYLIYKYGDKCMKCGWNEINLTTGIVPIQLEHKDGNSENHKLNNLELLCPNCHSLTPTYGALNKGNGRELRRIKRQSKKY